MNQPARPAGALVPIALGAALCGTFDLLFAFVYYGIKYDARPPGILRSIAVGLLGPTARLGGAETALLGGLLHFLIATGIAAAFWIASRRLEALRTHAVTSGLVYGVAVYFAMNWIVVPLSAVPAKAWPPPIDWIALAAHALLVGLPVALVVHRTHRPSSVPPHPADSRG